MASLLKIYKILLKKYDPQGWWPIRGKYTGGPKTYKQRLEVAIGAILTQNTSWKNVEKAIENLNKKNLINAKKLIKIPQKQLEEAVRPSGFFRQKAEMLKAFSKFVSNKKFESLTREELLKLKGIGPETADSILLYACGKPEFVVDAYTKRIFSRIGLITTENYEDVKTFFEKSLPKSIYNEYHALLVEHAKRFCKKIPECKPCPLAKLCQFKQSS